ncbi:MAG: SpoIIE family protein phosphatase [Bacteroidales bacterium]|nr:SpoIIE family protein phosphatase [Bacteroidales bacterium]
MDLIVYLIMVIILSVLLIAALAYIFWQRKQYNIKVQAGNTKILSAEEDMKVLSSRLESNQKEIAKNEKHIGELRNIIDNQKLRQIEMQKNLLVVQKTMLTSKGFIKSLFPDYFVLDVPYEIAGGDFYKFAAQGDYALAACGNSGVSGINGMIKGILNIVFLSEILERVDISACGAGRILDLLRGKYAHLSENNSAYRHDDDIPVNFTVCIINQKERTLSYAGAYGSMCILRKSYPGTNRREVDVHEYRGDKMNFAVSFGRRKNYMSENIELEKDDRVYIKTDGFVNQRGGSTGKRFGDIYFRQMLMKHAAEPMAEQMKSFKEEFDRWRGTDNRANDILVIGIALKIKAVFKPLPTIEDVFDEEPIDD